MTDPRIFMALDLPLEATPEQLARRLRALAGLPVEGSTDAGLWVRFIEAFKVVREMQAGPFADAGEMAHWVVEYAVVPAGFADEDRFGEAAWDREFGGIGAFETDGRLRKLVSNEVGPLLVKAGLYERLS